MHKELDVWKYNTVRSVYSKRSRYQDWNWLYLMFAGDVDMLGIFTRVTNSYIESSTFQNIRGAPFVKQTPQSLISNRIKTNTAKLVIHWRMRYVSTL
jgi:hypothetical protein